MALPDYPSLKRDISARLLLVMREGYEQQMGPFAESPHITYHEGDVTEFSTVDGEVRELEFETVETELTITRSEFASLTDEQIARAMFEAGVDLGRKTVQSHLSNLNRTLTAAGQVADGGGRPLDGEALLELLDMIEFSFDREGRLIMPSLITGNAEHTRVVDRLMNEDAEFRGKFAVLVQRKKEKWLAGESHRKLVD